MSIHVHALKAFETRDFPFTSKLLLSSYVAGYRLANSLLKLDILKSMPFDFIQKVMGPLSDVIGRRAGLILCSMITLFGALLSTFAWSEDALIAARVITGILGHGSNSLIYSEQ